MPSLLLSVSATDVVWALLLKVDVACALADSCTCPPVMLPYTSTLAVALGLATSTSTGLTLLNRLPGSDGLLVLLTCCAALSVIAPAAPLCGELSSVAPAGRVIEPPALTVIAPPAV